jgi:DNA-binding Lrp family transcriptional regulator
LKLDAVDSKILGALMEDGRASLNEIARKTSLTTPTVSARFERMKKAGLIKKFVPVVSMDSASRGVQAVILLKVVSRSPERLARDLAKIREVDGLYLTTGQGIVLRLTFETVRDLQSFLGETLGKREGVEVVSSEIVTGVFKEEPPSLPPGALTMSLKCDYCRGEVTSGRPYTINVDSSRYYFCCMTCKREYVEKHREKLQRLKALRS